MKTENIIIKIQDILSSIEKYGKDNILTTNFSVYRDNQQRNKNASQNKKQGSKQNSFDCTWLPFQFKTVSGKEVSLKSLKFNKVLTSSSAKMPHSTTEESAKNMLISFREVSEEELLTSGDYAPKKMGSEEEQIKENARAVLKAREYIENTRKLCLALEAIDASYKKCTDELKKATNIEFTINKDSNSVKQIKDNCKKAGLTKDELELEKNKVVTVYSIRQSSYEDKETKEEVNLKYPLTRIKLMVSKEGQVGTELYDNDKGGYVFTPNVYNSRKLDRNGHPTLAKVKINDKLCLLTIKTAGSFITYRSLVSGIIEFGEIVISKFGISLSNKFKVLYVKRHKASLLEPMFSPEEFKDMHGSDSESDEDVVVKNELSCSDIEDGEEKYYDDAEDIKPKNKSSKLAKVPVKMEKHMKPIKKIVKVKKESDNEGTPNTKEAFDSDEEDEPKIKSSKLAKASKLSKKEYRVKQESDDEVEDAAAHLSDQDESIISDEE
jgi:hypothetical protein